MKVGFLVDSLEVPDHVANMHAQCRALFGNQLVLVVNEFDHTNRLTLPRRLKEQGLKRLYEKLFFDAVTNLELLNLRLFRGRRLSSHKKRKLDLPPETKIIRILPLPSTGNTVYRYADQSIRELEEEKFDLIVRGEGRGILKDKILDVARHGIVSIHHGDNRKYRGGPPGYWEVCFGDPHSGVIVQKLDKSIDHGGVIARHTIATHNAFVANRQALFEHSVELMMGVLTFFKQKGELPPAEPASAPGKLYVTPTLWQSLGYTGTVIASAFKPAR